ncbi:uncharacterized protein LOC133175468 [Saccostrea echinata]|uniref:uncharacterized protein LOC133175468 n=1 Tax=Saccostrea echinata TaxID=191078 RepID=UPI002A8359D1|nr:uncharacterized protein LOC133175468 [Saccostrea echinata]
MRVTSCPESLKAWREREHLKGCYVPQNTCAASGRSNVTHMYHCLPNEFLNATYEVCMPATYILGKRCAEYNAHGRVIQSNLANRCETCPVRYISTDIYKYQLCYDLVKSSSKEISTKKIENQSINMIDDNRWNMILALLAVLAVFVFVIAIGVLLIIIRLRLFSSRKTTSGERLLKPCTNLKEV